MKIYDELYNVLHIIFNINNDETRNTICTYNYVINKHILTIINDFFNDRMNPDGKVIFEREWLSMFNIHYIRITHIILIEGLIMTFNT